MSRIIRALLCLTVAAVFSLAASDTAEAQRFGRDWDRHDRDWDDRDRNWDRRGRDWDDRDGYWRNYWSWYDGYYRPYYYRRSFRPNYGYGYSHHGSPSTYYYRPYQHGIQLGDFGIYWR